jgi:hypothetical protein
MTDRPSDSPLDEPDTTVRHLHCDLRQRIDRFRSNVVEFRPHLNAQQQLRHDLANAFRSNEAAGKYDGDDK